MLTSETKRIKGIVEERCQTNLHLSLPELLSLVEQLENVRLILGKDCLHTERVIGLKEGSVSADPLECAFVLKALLLMVEQPKAFEVLRSLMEDISNG